MGVSMYKRVVFLVIGLILVLSSMTVLFTFFAQGAPTFSNESSTTFATTGDPFTFQVDSSGGEDDITVDVTYWFGIGSSTTTINTMSNTSGTFTHTISANDFPDDSTDYLYWTYNGTDGTNTIESGRYSRVVSDNDEPIFGTDGSDISGTTGETFSFSIGVTDNIDTPGVYVEYWFGTGSHTNSTMAGSSGTNTSSVNVPSDAAVIHYIFHANDTAGNLANMTQVDIAITDNDKPVFWIDGSDTSGTTGESFNFSIGVTDNIDTPGVYVEYWFGTGSHTNSTMAGSSGTNTSSVTVPSDAAVIHYIFSACDSSGNWANMAQTDITITDNDKPVFGTDDSDTTGTTGETFSFSIGVTDNIGVTVASVEYWFGDGPHTNSIMTGSGPYTSSVSVPSDAAVIHYIFSARDSASNLANMAQTDITITDNDKPVFGVDGSDTSGTTGETFSFSISVTDNIDVPVVYVEYWFNFGNHINSTMIGSSGTNTSSVLIPINATKIHYIYSARDSAGNWAEKEKTIIITDNDAPSFTDQSPTTGTTGNQYTFNVTVTDNIGVTSVYVEYWFGTGSHHIANIIGNLYFEKTINIPADSTDPIFYFFNASDAQGNWDITVERSVLITDNDRPTWGIESSDTVGTTGDIFLFNISVNDNIGVEMVYVEYWYGNGEADNVSMIGTSIYYLDITLPADSTDDLHYIFHATDAQGNWAQMVEKSVMITDNDKPTWDEETSDAEGTTGDTFLFNISVNDNIGIDTVFVNYHFGTRSVVNISMEGSGPYSYELDIPSDSTDGLHYSFHFSDEKGNWAYTTEKTITITDNDRPIFTGNVPSNGTTGDSYRFSAIAFDNIGINTVVVEYWFGSGSRINVTMAGDGPYTYDIVSLPADSTDPLHFIFHATDLQGNWAQTDEAIVTIHDNDRILFVDGSPDLGTTGDTYLFNVTVSDNIGVSGVFVEYWFGNGDVINVSMTGTSIYYLDITLPDDSTDPLKYIFHASDIQGNWGITQMRMILISDDDDPVLEADDSSSTGTTGDEFIFEITASDRVDLEMVTATWSHGSLNGTDIPLLDDGDGTWSLSIILDHSIASFSYDIELIDSSGNTITGPVRIVTITDNDLPTIRELDGVTIYSGVPFSFQINATDNVGIQEIKWSGLPTTYYGSVIEGYTNQSGEYTMTVTVTDGEGNLDQTTFPITVLSSTNDIDEDGIPDLVEIQYGLNIYEQQDAMNDLDNDGLTNIAEYENGTALDDPDTDDDLMPDVWEIDHGLDPLLNTSTNDEDGDGKTDLQEYLDGTDPTKAKKDEGTMALLITLLTTPIVIAVIIGLVVFFIIRKRRKIIRLIGQKAVEGPKDVFISYAHTDQNTAYSICNKLEEGGYKCWIAPRDVIPGMAWAKSIIMAINSAKVMVLVFSSESNESQQVLREIERAVNKDIPIILFRISNIMPSEELEYYISALHWLDAFNEPISDHLDNLTKTIDTMLAPDAIIDGGDRPGINASKPPEALKEPGKDTLPELPAAENVAQPQEPPRMNEGAP